MVQRYDHKKIEPKWKKLWAEKGIFRTKAKKGRKKIYLLDMFPYPSGEGLHVGHPRGYVASDILARYFRLKGLNVLHPMGFDAFGLPAENAAIQRGVPPAKNTAENIKRFKKQLAAFSLSYDSRREVVTSDPKYYKWTQWLFLLLYKNGLAYRKKANVNWCPKDKTVLANEQVVDGRCERCGTQVVQKQLTQWFFKITAFADELLKGLDSLDWPESTKELQRHWIGKSIGWEIDFPIDKARESIKVFTTRADTLFGATYLVLAPEHPLVGKLAKGKEKKEVATYIKTTSGKTELERLAEGKVKTGVFTGSYAINPATKKKIPIWLADYVLPHYGTGAIMAVPAHDERDFDFAKKFKLPIVRVIEGGELPYSGIGALINSDNFNGLMPFKASDAIAKKVGGRQKVQYRLRDWLISRQRYWGAPIPVIYDKAGNIMPVDIKDLPVKLPEDVDFRPTGLSPLTRSKKFQAGVEKKYGRGAHRETDTMDTFVDSSWYFLRYADPDNQKEFAGQEALTNWLPVDLYIGGAEHATGHLIFARFLTKVLHKLGYLNFNEPFLKLRHQGLIMGTDGFKMSKSRGNVINPDSLIEKFGADSFRLYEMFIGPFSQNVAWNVRGIEGVHRFLGRIFAASQKVAGQSSKEAESALHNLIKKITHDIENFKFNTAVSGLMEFFNGFGEKMSKAEWQRFLVLLYPFAPHLACELWSRFKIKGELWNAAWPGFDERLTQSKLIKLPVQINGKLKGLIEVAPNASEGEVLELIKKDKRLAPLIVKIKKVIYRAGRIVNLVS